MKWKEPEDESVRIKRIFAFLPHECLDDGYIHWLEFIYLKETYNSFQSYGWGYYKFYYKNKPKEKLIMDKESLQKRLDVIDMK